MKKTKENQIQKALENVFVSIDSDMQTLKACFKALDNRFNRLSNIVSIGYVFIILSALVIIIF